MINYTNFYLSFFFLSSLFYYCYLNENTRSKYHQSPKAFYYTYTFTYLFISRPRHVTTFILSDYTHILSTYRHAHTHKNPFSYSIQHLNEYTNNHVCMQTWFMHRNFKRLSPHNLQTIINYLNCLLYSNSFIYITIHKYI